MYKLCSKPQTLTNIFTETVPRPTWADQYRGTPGSVTPAMLASSLATVAAQNASFRHQGPHDVQGLVGGWPGQQEVPATAAQGLHLPQGAHGMVGGLLGQQDAQPPAAHDHGLTVYIKKCSKCSWESIATTDPKAYQGAVADLELHMKHAHADQKEDRFSSHINKESEEYRRATQLVDVPATQDDCHLNLSPVRFFRAPLSWKNSQLQLPVEQQPVCTYGDYEPYGIEINNRGLLKDLHNRAIKNHRLKVFSDRNMKVTPSQQENLVAFDKGSSGNLITTKEWKELLNEKEALKAAHNYMELCRAIHPLDSGPQILFKTMLEKYLAGGTSAKQLEDFFSSVTWELANRAAKSELPYKHAELMLKWDQLYRYSSTPQVPPVGGSQMDKQLMVYMKRMMETTNNHSPKKAKQSHSWCLDFNKQGTGCTNPAREGGGCTDKNGRNLKHGCSFRTEGKTCNSLDHNRWNHAG